ncbi:MAG: hypothetical protein GF401_08540 [Chitinivibrionales bacterium]|nr:hypothetical protein [Chitinivibrionales bacterium]
MIRKNHSQKFLLCAITASLIFVVCTSENTLNASNQSSEGGVAKFKIVAASDSPFREVADYAVLTISDENVPDLNYTLTVTDSSIEGLVSGIPVGEDKLFTIAVYDSYENLQYRGESRADIIADSTIFIAITLRRVSGSAYIYGVIEEIPSVSPSSELVAHWRFNEANGMRAYDNSGNDHTGEIHGAQWEQGIAGSALLFDGTDDYVEIADKISDFHLTTYSIEAWIKPSELPLENGCAYCADMFIYSTIHTSAGMGNCLLFRDGRLMASQNTGGWCWKTTTVPVMDGKWHHVASTFDGSTLRLYFDGEIVEYWTCSSAISYDQTPVSIGASPWQSISKGYFHGLIDEVAVWNVALDSLTVLNHYTAYR